MPAPTNLDFSQPGSTPGEAVGWVSNIVNAGTVIADFRGTQPEPLGFDDFGHDWSNDQAWAGIIPIASFAVFDIPTIPAGQTVDDFSVGWDSYPAMHAPTTVGFLSDDTTLPTSTIYIGDGSLLTAPGAVFIEELNTTVQYTGITFSIFLGWRLTGCTGGIGTLIAGQHVVDVDVWPAPATGPLTVYLFAIDAAAQAGFDAPVPPAVLPSWMASTPYAYGSRVESPANGGVYQVVFVYGAGDSGTGPPPTGSFFMDGTTSNGLLWEFSSASANPEPLAYEPFSAGWTATPAETDLQPPAWTASTAYLVGEVVRSSGNWYAVTAIAGAGVSGTVGPSGTGTFTDNQVTWACVRVAPSFPTEVLNIASSTNATPITVHLASPHGVAVGQSFGAFITGHADNPAANGLWAGALAATATSSTALTLPGEGTGVGGADGTLSVNPQFDTNLAPPAWAPDTDYAAGVVVTSSGSWWQADNAGTSGTGAGPSGAGPTFTDDAGPLQIVWSFVRTAPTGPLYAFQIGMFDSGADGQDDFSVGWDVDTWSGVIVSRTQAAWRGWIPGGPNAPSTVAAPRDDREDFWQQLQPSTGILTISVDVGGNQIVLAPGRTIVDGTFVTFAATPPFAAYGSTFPAPIVPGVEYIAWNTTNLGGSARIRVGDPSTAQYTAVTSATNTNPIQVTTPTPHNLQTGDVVFIFGEAVNTNANGFWVVTVLNSFQFTIPNAANGVGGPTGTVFGPIFLVTLTTAGAAQLTVTQDLAWDWPAPG